MGQNEPGNWTPRACAGIKFNAESSEFARRNRYRITIAAPQLACDLDDAGRLAVLSKSRVGNGTPTLNAEARTCEKSKPFESTSAALIGR